MHDVVLTAFTTKCIYLVGPFQVPQYDSNAGDAAVPLVFLT